MYPCCHLMGPRRIDRFREIPLQVETGLKLCIRVWVRIRTGSSACPLYISCYKIIVRFVGFLFAPLRMECKDLQYMGHMGVRASNRDQIKYVFARAGVQLLRLKLGTVSQWWPRFMEWIAVVVWVTWVDMAYASSELHLLIMFHRWPYEL